MKRWAPLIALLIAWTASGAGVQVLIPPVVQPVNGGGTVGGSSGSGSGGSTDRHTFICLVPDTQHLTSSAAWLRQRNTCRSDDPTSPAYVANGGITCSGASCADSPLCKGSWYETGRQLFRNLAYDLIGQWSLEDYSGIGEPDGVPVPYPSGAQDHPRCDVILSLGDMMDIPSFHAGDGEGSYGWTSSLGGTVYVEDSPTYDQMPAWQKEQYQAIEEFWTIIKNSGIPFLPIPGNHDPRDSYDRLMTNLGFTSLSTYYDRETTLKQQYAIKFPTPTGKTFCALNLSGILSTVSSFDISATEVTWAKNNVGCGGDYPTILLQHGATNGLGITEPHTYDVANAAGSGEVIMVAGGHYFTTQSGKSLTANRSTFPSFKVITVFSNWQEVSRRGGGSSSLPAGATEQDQAGLYYTVIEIAPDEKKVIGWDWSPYWRSRQYRAVVSGPATSTLNADFDFDARFP